MLQVSLTPAAVAHRQVSKGWRKFLMTSRGKIGHMDAPAATAEQSGLHHVVAHDMAAHGFLAAKFWQTAAFGEGPHPQYGVVTPESCFGSRPPDEDRTRDCATSRGGDRPPPGDECTAVDDRGTGLNQERKTVR